MAIIAMSRVLREKLFIEEVYFFESLILYCPKMNYFILNLWIHML